MREGLNERTGNVMTVAIVMSFHYSIPNPSTHILLLFLSHVLIVVD